MKKAAVPVNYIVAIALAVLALSLLAYFLIQSFKGGGKQLSYNECYAMFVSYCATHGTSEGFNEEHKECAQYTFGDCPSITSSP